MQATATLLDAFQSGGSAPEDILPSAWAEKYRHPLPLSNGKNNDRVRDIPSGVISLAG